MYRANYNRLKNWTAYYINITYGTNWRGQVLFVQHHYNCFDEEIGHAASDVENAAKWEEIAGMHSKVTLKMTAEGCCPKRLMKDFIMREGELAERDPALEAMKLHKRGYFGGGG